MRPRSLAVLASLLVLSVACGGRPPCDARSCAAGCCSASGECVFQGSVAACGLGGQQCLPCAAGQSCLGGRCLSGSTGGGTGGGSGSGGAGGGSASHAPSCTAAADCPYWYCNCRAGPPVNSQRCVNGVCLDGAQACPGACAGFGTCWLGTSSGGFTGGSNAGPSTCGVGGGAGGGAAGGGGGSTASCPVSDLGRGCATAADCQSALCFGVSPSFICTRACAVANDCPRGWECVSTSNGNHVCMEGGRNGTTPSTGSVCAAAPITDVGQTCNASCQGGFCSANLCSRRCISGADCPPSWTCNTTGSSFNYCAP